MSMSGQGGGRRRCR